MCDGFRAGAFENDPGHTGDRERDPAAGGGAQRFPQGDPAEKRCEQRRRCHDQHGHARPYEDKRSKQRLITDGQTHDAG